MYDISIEEVERDKRNGLVIDLRRREDFEKGSLPEARNIFLEDVEKQAGELAEGRPVYLLCYSGHESEEAADLLREKGIEAYSIEGGYRQYLKKRLESFLREEKKHADRHKEIERSIIKKFRKELWKKFTSAINEYQLIEEGDKIAD